MPSTTECPHCGAQLEGNYVTLMGRRAFCGWKPCGCPGAVAERAERARQEARAKAEEAAAKRRRASRAGRNQAPLHDSRLPHGRGHCREG